MSEIIIDALQIFLEIDKVWLNIFKKLASIVIVHFLILQVSCQQSK